MYQIKHTVKNQFGYFDMEAYRTSQEHYYEEYGCESLSGLCGLYCG